MAMSISPESLKQLLHHVQAVLQETDRAVAAARGLQAAAGLDDQQLHEQLVRAGGPMAPEKARARLGRLLERRDAKVQANAAPDLRRARFARASRFRTNLV